MPHMLLYAFPMIFMICFLKGLQQFILDVHFILKSCIQFVTNETTSYLNVICGRYLKRFLDEHKKDGNGYKLKASKQKECMPILLFSTAVEPRVV